MTTGSSAFLVDTNVLVYMHDPRDSAKQERAIETFSRIVEAGDAVLSAQCLSEFFRVVTTRLPEPLTSLEAHAEVERFARLCRVLPISAAVVLEGCRGVVEHRFSIWDSLIWAAAKINQVPTVLTEDAEHARFLEGVRYFNPLLPGFDPYMPE